MSNQLPKESTQSVKRLVWSGGETITDSDQVVRECAVALVYNGISHVVMMLTPIDLKEFALGFSLSEGILEEVDQLLDFQIVETELGLELQMTILTRLFERLKQRRRNLTGRTGCGLCGAESLEQAVAQPHAIDNNLQINHQSIEQAVGSLQSYQILQQQTGAVHAAAWCDLDGTILLLKEAVGRHNALDKLLGAMHLRLMDRQGFVLVTSRASYEMVTKAASANVAVLVAVSAVTSMAVEIAQQCGLTLVGFAQPGRHVIYGRAERIK